ncbi:MAG TPA: hypothetical protein VN799_00505 [Acidimicrobiales bacterium]|nr:hypothetical protein [Acidimicrobiales bacterium]
MLDFSDVDPLFFDGPLSFAPEPEELSDDVFSLAEPAPSLALSDAAPSDAVVVDGSLADDDSFAAGRLSFL